MFPAGPAAVEVRWTCNCSFIRSYLLGGLPSTRITTQTRSSRFPAERRRAAQNPVPLEQRPEVELLEVPELVGQHVLGEVGVDDGDLGDRTEPGHARLAVLPDVVAEERCHAGRDVVAPQRQRPSLIKMQYSQLL